MKREFGKKLIEEFFPRVDLTHVIDTSGVYIPGHGTPTVVLVGRNQMPRQNDAVRAVLGVRGEPSQPADPEQGFVWQAIATQTRMPGSESDWVTVEDLNRTPFNHHPWSLSGGGASHLMAQLTPSTGIMKDATTRIGFFGDSHADEAFTLPTTGPLARKCQSLQAENSHRGDQTRDWTFSGHDLSVHPYTTEGELLEEADLAPAFVRHFWPLRTELWMRGTFGGSTYRDDDRKWWEWHQHPKDEKAGAYSITYSEVATHNHFVLDRNGKVFNRTAPIIKLPKEATEEQHLELLGLLNSSSACFWMKQVSHDKGSQSGTGGFMHDEWERFYQFAATKLSKFPLPKQFPLALSREIDALAQALATHEPSALAREAVPTREALDDARRAQEQTQARMIALQEELDWTVYGAYGLLTDDAVAQTSVPLDAGADVPKVALGQRAFEIVLARSGAETVWFDRHGSTPVTEIPDHWPDAYKKVVQARIDLIEANKDIRLIERPEYKRRWSIEPWEKREATALQNWLLDAAEREELWFEEQEGFTVPRPLTVNQLADELRHDKDVQDVATLYAADHLGKRDASLATVLAAVIEPEHVPYLAALRYKDSGLRKRAQWEQVWEQQREEDRTGQRLDIKVPPKYTSADFLKQSYWSHRGKLDVPKERFISYPGASPEADGSLLLGWAGWNHRDQADALVGMIRDRVENGGWAKEDPRFVPLLAGLREVLPWVHQWYGEYDEEWEGNPAEEFQAALETGRTERQLSESDLINWRPEKKTRGRPKKSE
ncbi:BREX-2 system adenine-specific DNA-methyltransferase PglX [Streptomyces sp. NTH33]|uniref:BREX-2 system adenine-specific DNA-methyltransferase PglX n=1 Tax=Streptomyces sp. NTH33 TaxID=1735453 RepID=UPI003F8E22F7